MLLGCYKKVGEHLTAVGYNNLWFSFISIAHVILIVKIIIKGVHKVGSVEPDHFALGSNNDLPHSIPDCFATGVDELSVSPDEHVLGIADCTSGFHFVEEDLTDVVHCFF